MTALCREHYNCPPQRLPIRTKSWAKMKQFISLQPE